MIKHICPKCDAINSEEEWDKATTKFFGQITSITDKLRRNLYVYMCPYCKGIVRYMKLIELEDNE